MEFEIAPRPLRHRGRRRAAIAAAGIVAVVAFGLATAAMPAAPPDAPSPDALAAATTAGPASSAAVVGAPAAGPLARPSLPEPSSIVCRDLDRTVCVAVARASMTVLTTTNGRVTGIVVSHSLMCDDDRACSASKVAGAGTLGSAVLSLASGAQAWVNVAAPATIAGRDTDSAQPAAWVVRWVP